MEKISHSNSIYHVSKTRECAVTFPPTFVVVQQYTVCGAAATTWSVDLNELTGYAILL